MIRSSVLGSCQEPLDSVNIKLPHHPAGSVMTYRLIKALRQFYLRREVVTKKTDVQYN